MDPDLGVDPDPPWIRIHMIPIPALLDVIPAPDPDPQKSGVVTPLIPTDYFRVNYRVVHFLEGQG